MNVKGGTEMTDEELAAAGANKSMTHVDFMFGSRHMDYDGHGLRYWRHETL